MRSREEEIKEARFNSQNTEEFMTTSQKKVRFWEKKNQNYLTSYEPSMIKKDDFSKDKDNSRVFIQSEFLPEKDSTQAVSATEDGQLIMWDVSLILEESINVKNRREVKSINLLSSFNKVYEKKAGISNLLVHERLIVIGTNMGSVRFYDFRFRIICWFENIGLGKVTSISFAKNKFNYDQFWQSHLENSELKENREYNFEYVDFVVADANARVHLVECSLFSEIESANRQGKLLLEGIRKPIVALATEPGENKAILSCADGKVYSWTIYSPFLTVIKDFREENEIATCLAYSPDGQYLVAGTSQGNILVKHKGEPVFGSTALLISHKKKGICCEKVQFSPDGKCFAMNDHQKCVSLFKLGHKYDDPAQEIQWVFSGKIKSHTGRIRDIRFARKGIIPEKQTKHGHQALKVSEPYI